jgi:hypothetical protein
MTAIGMSVGDVVDQVDDTREDAEDRKGRRGITDRGGIEQPLPEEEGGENDEVLGPLLGPQGPDQVQGDRPLPGSRGRGMHVDAVEGIWNAMARH